MATATPPRIEGKLTGKALADIFKRLEGNRSAAYMLVSDGLAEKCLYFSVGAIRLSSMGKRRVVRLEDALVAHPRVEPGMVERARIRQQESGEPFEEVLATRFDLNDVVRECSTAIVRDEVLDLLVWDGAYFEYVEANPPPKIFDPRLEAVKLSFGAVKLLKEAADGVPKAQKVVQRAPGRARIARGPAWTYGAPEQAEKAVCEAIAEVIAENGATLDDIVLHGRRRGFDAVRICDALDKMFEQKTLDTPKKGQAAALSREDEVELAKKEVVEIENALDLIINELVARQRLAKCYLTVGDQPRAVFNLKKVGDELLHRNKAEEAIDTFRQIVKIVPHDFGVREKIAFLYQRMKRIPEAIGEGLELAKIYKQFGLFNRAKNIFRRVIALDPANIDHRRQLIELLVKLKENQEAIGEYEALADIYAKGEREDDLLAVYQEILGLDPTHGFAKRRTQAIVRRRPGFWIPYVGIAAGFLVLALAAAYVGNEYTALKAYRKARATAFERADAGDYLGARAAVEDFLRRHESSRSAPKARALKTQLAELEAERRERAAREEYARAVELETGGRALQAYEMYSRLRSTAAGTTWEAESAARMKAIDALSEKAEFLLSQVKRLEGDRNFRDAFDRARELVRKYPWSDAAGRLEVKLEVASMPSGAQVTVDGRPAGRTPCMVSQRAAVPFALSLALQGFAPETREIDLRADLAYPYSVELSRALRWKATLYGPIEAPPLVEAGGVFVAGRDQRLYALDPDGRVRWLRPLGLCADVTAQPLRAGSRIIVGDRTGTITAVDAASGVVAWRGHVRGSALPVMAPSDGIVVVAGEEGSIVGFEVAGGKERYRVGVPGGIAAAPSPSEADRTVIVPTGEGQILVLDALSGAEHGRIATGSRATAPVAVDGRGYLACVEGGLAKFFAHDGRLLWQAKTPGAVAAAPLVAGGAAFVGAGNSLVALELRDGSERWPRREFRSAIRATPAFLLNRLYVATGDGAVHALTAETGFERWTYRTEGEIVARPVPVQDAVYVASTDFGVYAIRD